MRCRACNYALWGITERTCPECGTSFDPSAYEFVPGTVLFCCPHCDKRYHGMDERGHPEPAAFTCRGCGHAIELAEMVLRIAVATPEAETRPGVVPWLERRHRGRLKAFFQTVGMALVQPSRLGRGIPPNASVGEAIVYALVVTLALFTMGAVIPAILWFAGAGAGFVGGGMGSSWILLWMSVQMLLGLTVVLSLFVVWPITIHAVLRLTGGCRHGIDRTFQAFGYSAGANVLSAIPCFGMYLGWIWWVLSATLVVRAAQRVSGGRAALAVLALPLVVVLVVGGAVGLITFGAARSVGTALGAPVRTPGHQQTLVLAGAIQNQAWRNPQRAGGPEHAIELVLGGMISPGFGGSVSPFIQPGTATRAKDVPVGDGTLADFTTLSSSAQIGQIKKVLDAVPKNLVAHRVGDFVFTYHGAKLNTNDVNLWIVVMLPDPDVNGTPASGDDVHIGSGALGVRTITYGAMAKKLAKQNTYRATLGLPPLPDPVTVTHDKPAVATAR